MQRRAWIVTWIFATLPLLGWWLYGLFDMDEGFYGAVVAEMNRRGEWITPYYNGHPWFEKPILLYWLAKPSMLLFGQWLGPRLPSILATIGTYLLVAWFARRRWDDHAARWCVLVTASSILVVGVGRMMMTDALLNVCLVGAFVFFWESLVGDRRWRLLSALFLGLSVLAKGPVGILLFVPVAGWTFWRERDLREAFRGWWLLGTLVLAATIATWYLPAFLVNGHEFVQKFLIEQNLNRFTGGDPAHTPPYFVGLATYFVVLLVCMAPWSFYFWRAWPRPGSGVERYLVVWALVPFVFFTISKAKLPHYVLPCAVPLAMLVGVHLARRTNEIEDRIRALRYPLIACGVVAVLVNAVFLLYYNWDLLSGHAEVHRLAFFVRDNAAPGDDVAAYQMPRRQHDLGTGKPKIQETSHPSLVMYLNRTINEPDDMATLLADPHGEWVITRWNRIGPAEIDAAHHAGRDLEPVDTGHPPDLYRLYYLSPAPGPRTRRPG
ncbi:MAG TPA: glycosyltransferase family 39 protein [Fimbriimonadaceae bacterium]|nr:glycosyltransferase family 39 protein [Fimbriimonadaceae bacterium]